MVAVGTQDDGQQEKNMDTQRNDIGDRAAPVEVPENVQALDPSTRQEHTGTEGEVEQPGQQAASEEAAPAVQQSASPEVQRRPRSPKVAGPSPANLTAIGKLESRQHDLRVRTRDQQFECEERGATNDEMTESQLAELHAERPDIVRANEKHVARVAKWKAQTETPRFCESAFTALSRGL